MPRDSFIDGVPELLLLRLLGQREMYGYELVAEIRSRSQGVFTFGEGCVYPILHRLANQKYLSVRRDSVSGRPRRYYRLTAKGGKRLENMEQSWNNVSIGIASFGKEVANATA